jgi:hypothetical protein
MALASMPHSGSRRLEASYSVETQIAAPALESAQEGRAEGG